MDVYSLPAVRDKRSISPKRFLEIALEILQYALLRGKAERKIRRLRKKLRNLGFYERASSELLDIIDKTNGYGIGALAARELLCFCLDHYDPKHESLAARCLELVLRTSKTSEERRTAAIMAAEFYKRLGRLEEAQQCLSEALSSQRHPDLYLAMANLHQDKSQKIHNINQAFETQGLSPIFAAADDKGILYDLLDVDDGHHRTLERPELVSIILPAFNSARTITTALRAIQRQTWTNFECIVVDDCSTDDTIDVVEDFISGDKRFTLIKLAENSGCFVARNSALEIAAGQFITCHDADDWSHPNKIELQVNCLLADSASLASISSQAPASEDLSFTRRSRFGVFARKNLSSLMARREVFDELGCWDSVRFGADGEFLRRFEKQFGPEKLVKLPHILSFQRMSPASLTGGKNFGYSGYFFGARQYYFERQMDFHGRADSLRYSFPMERRPFATPSSMLPRRDISMRNRHFDVIIASDFRMEGGSTLSSVEEMQAQHRAGLRTGIVQICRYDYDPYRGLNPKVAAALDSGTAEIVAYGEEVTCDLLVIRYPPVLQEFQSFIPKVTAKHIKVIINQPPMSDYGPKAVARYTIPECVKNLRRYFGKDAVWHPIGPAVRDAIALHHPQWLDEAAFSERDWHNIVDLREWRRSNHKISERPIIGRHSRDHVMKWPANRRTMLAAYPSGNEFEIRVLGGAKSARKVIGALPSNWTVYPFDSVPPAEFLSSLDVFVYFTNEAWVESFGRVVIEAMSVGVPVILPFSYKALFEEAALYAEPEAVQPLVRKLVSDPQLYQAQVERAFAYVDEKFGYGMHIERVKALLMHDRESD